MNPAYSVIFFTTATGAGYGLLMLLALGAAPRVLPAEPGFGITAFATALGLITAGLLASTVHLGHPERAWRALTQWRSSWLSREGLASLAVYPPAVCFAFGWTALGANTGVWAAAGLLAALLALITIVCTAMIYASLKPVPQWRNGWVVPVYVAFGFALGSLLLNLLLHAFGLGAAWATWLAAGCLAAAWSMKLAYWRHIDRTQPVSTSGSATGLGRFGSVRQLESPHTAVNFVMKEMGYGLARRHALKLRRYAVVIGGVVPLVLLAAAQGLAQLPAGAVLGAGAAAAFAGILIERWLFFAEAQHVVTLYY